MATILRGSRRKELEQYAKEIGAKVGDIIKVVRKSTTARQSVFYRLVID